MGIWVGVGLQSFGGGASTTLLSEGKFYQTDDVMFAGTSRLGILTSPLALLLVCAAARFKHNTCLW